MIEFINDSEFFLQYLRNIEVEIGQNFNQINENIYHQIIGNSSKLLILDFRELNKVDSCEKIIKLSKALNLLREIHICYFIKTPNFTFENITLLCNAKCGSMLFSKIQAIIATKEQDFLLFKQRFFEHLFTQSGCLGLIIQCTGPSVAFKSQMAEIAISQVFYIIDSKNSIKNLTDL